MPRNPGIPVQSVDRALSLLRIVCDEACGITLTELGQRTGLAVQTVQSLLRTLQAHGLVAQAGRGAPYVPGPALATWGTARATREARVARVRPLVADCMRRTGESVLLASLSGQSVLGLVFIQADQPLTVNPAKTFLNLDTMATGRVLLAQLPESRREALVQRLLRSGGGAKAGRTAERLLEQVRQAQTQGWTETVDEAVVGVAAVAVSVPAPAPHLLALGVCLPTARYGARRRESLLKELRRTAARIAHGWADASPM